MEKTFPSVINLNVGGSKFITRLSTLRKYPDSMLSTMFSGRHDLDQDRDGYYFIDRNGKHFCHILEFLRDDQYRPPKDILEEILKGAEYFMIFDLVNRLKELPPLFPFYGVKEDIRQNVTNYSQFKEQVIKMAKSAAPGSQTKSFATSRNEVFVNTIKTRKYTTNARLMGIPLLPIHADSMETVHRLLAGKQYENKSLFRNKDEIDNFEGFTNTLLYDIQQMGYSVTLSLLVVPAAKGSLGALLSTRAVVYNNEECIVEDSAIFQFEWF